MSIVKTHFERDNFDSRRTTGHNMFDPESFITGREIAQGFTFTNSHRDYPGQHTYDAIVAGDVPMAMVELVAPRVFNETRSTGIKFIDEVIETDDVVGGAIAELLVKRVHEFERSI